MTFDLSTDVHWGCGDWPRGCFSCHRMVWLRARWTNDHAHCRRSRPHQKVGWQRLVETWGDILPSLVTQTICRFIVFAPFLFKLKGYLYIHSQNWTSLMGHNINSFFLNALMKQKYIFLYKTVNVLKEHFGEFTSCKKSLLSFYLWDNLINVSEMIVRHCHYSCHHQCRLFVYLFNMVSPWPGNSLSIGNNWYKG